MLQLPDGMLARSSDYTSLYHQPLTAHEQLLFVILQGYNVMEYLQVAAKELSAVLMIIDWHLPLQYCDYNYCHSMCCSNAVRQMIFVLCSIYLTDNQTVSPLPCFGIGLVSDSVS